MKTLNKITYLIRNGYEREYSTKDQGCAPRPLRRISVSQWITGLGFMAMVADGRHDEVSTVCRDHSGLRKPRTRVVFLDDRVDTHDGDDNA
jgi:hypothetical protein